MKYLLDTHAWIWWHMNPGKLSPKVRALIADTGRYEELLLSGISPWEFCKLLQKGRLEIACDTEEWIQSALDMHKLRLCLLTPVIAFKSTTLPGLFHDDPADQIIVATAREENAVIITRDDRIRNYPQAKSIW